MDEFLSQFRKQPRPEFVRALSKKLAQSQTEKDYRRWIMLFKWRPIMATSAVVLTLVVLFSFPAVRVAAQEFLNLFRVKRFTAIKVDPTRIELLKENKIDMAMLLGNKVEVLQAARTPEVVNSMAVAAQMTGMAVRAPELLAKDAAAPEIRVISEHRFRLVSDTTKLEEALGILGITDLQVPPALNGATINVNIPTAVMMRYTRGEEKIEFLQARSPEILLPENIDLAQLGEIGLRIAGFSPEQATEFAQSINWRSTFLMPIPANVASFREVDVRGVKGLLIEHKVTDPDAKGRARGSILLWSEQDKIYALSGRVSTRELLTMANSLQ